MKKLTLFFLAIMLCVVVNAQSPYFEDSFSCSLGNYMSEQTVAKNTDSRGTLVSPPHWLRSRHKPSFWTYSTHMRYHVYLSSNATLESYDVKLTTINLTGWIEDTGNYYYYRFPYFEQNITIPKHHLSNGYFKDKMYLIVTSQHGSKTRHYDDVNRVDWWSERTRLVHEVDVIDRATLDPRITVTKFPNRPGYWPYEFKVDNIGTVYKSQDIDWNLRLVKGNGSVTIFTSGTTRVGRSRTVSGYVNIPQVFTFPAFPTDYIYFQIYPESDQRSINNQVKTLYSYH